VDRAHAGAVRRRADRPPPSAWRNAAAASESGTVRSTGAVIEPLTSRSWAGNVASMGVDADEVFRREIDAPVFETPPTG